MSVHDADLPSLWGLKNRCRFMQLGWFLMQQKVELALRVPAQGLPPSKHEPSVSSVGMDETSREGLACGRRMLKSHGQDKLCNLQGPVQSEHKGPLFTN